jgi:hypothetical protein
MLLQCIEYPEELTGEKQISLGIGLIGAFELKPNRLRNQSPGALFLRIEEKGPDAVLFGKLQKRMPIHSVIDETPDCSGLGMRLGATNQKGKFRCVLTDHGTPRARTPPLYSNLRGPREW